MEQRPRSQSVLQIRAPNLPSRASKLIQKVSNFKGRIRLLSRKSKDDRDINNPYPSQSRSMDGGFKPYMSHPMLGNMIVEPFDPRDRDAEDSSSQSGSPSGSEFRRPLAEALISRPGEVRAHNGSQYSISTGLISATQAGAAFGAIRPKPSIDGLPAISDAHTRPLFNVSRTSATTGVSKPVAQHRATPSIVISNPPESTQRPSIDRPSSSSGPKKSTPKSATPNTNLSPARIFTRKQSRTRLKDTLEHDAPPPRPETPTSPPTPPVPTRPATISYNSSSAHTASLPALQPSHTPRTVPTRRETAPRLTLPPHSHRFSLTMLDGSAARLSPSVIMRPPPLPILNLPTLPTIQPPSSSPSSTDNRRGGVGLRSMPELPHVGTERGDDGDGDEEGDMEDEFDEEESDAMRAGSSSALSHFDDENYPRPSMSSSMDSDGLLPSSISRVKSHSRSSSYQEHAFLALPGPDTSRIDLSFLDHPPPSPSAPDRKGKGKARQGPNDHVEDPEDEHDTARTPTSSSPYRDYFSSQTRGTGSFHDAMPNINRFPPRKDSLGASPVRTPRAEDTFRAILPIPMQASVSMRTGDVLMPLHSTPSRPGMYKHASRSLIDLHTIEKKERVEQIVRAEEQAADEKRRSIIMGKRRQSTLDAAAAEQDDGEWEAPPVDADAGLQKRVSKAPPYEAPYALRRRRSMPTFNPATLPPPYPSFAPFAHPMSSAVKILPRDDEGCERLPPYSNDIYIRAIIPRKMEFVAAGVQAKDRKWRRVMCVLEGTSLKIYRPAGATGVSAIGEWWEKKVGVGDVSNSAGTSTAAGGSGAAFAANTERVPKLGEERDGVGMTELIIKPPSQPPSPVTPITPARTQPHLATQPAAASRSRLNLAVNLLRPSRPHGRSISDIPNPPSQPRSPRSSLNILATSSSSRDVNSRSDSPTTVAPSMAPSERSMNLSIPSPSSSSHATSVSSRPTTASSGRPQSRTANSTDQDPVDLIKAYTMQNAESGLGNDYIKRKNVIRVRVEGEQFLLQAKDVADVVAWIEALQASANVALDLDERIMPKGPLFPRRRRRRARRPATDTIEPASDNAGTANIMTSTDT